MASTNTTSIAYSLETVPGTTNASPTFLTLPTTSSSLTSNLTTAVSEVIRSDRQTDDLVVTDSEISGDIGFELSYAPWKPLLIALLQGDGTGTTIAAETAATAVNATSSFDLAGIETGRSVGDAIYASAASDDGSNDDIAGVYIITALGTDLITVTPTPRDSTADVAIREAVVHSNGAEVPNSYTFRTTAQNDAGTTYYYYHRGCQISSMNMNFSTGSILNGTTSVIGRSEEATPTAIAGETITPTPAYTIMNSVTSIGAISVGGVSLGTCSFSSMDLTVDNNINQAKSIGTLGACALASFALNVTGNIEIYFNNLDAYNKFLNASSFSVSFALKDGDSNLIGVNMKNCKFESLSHPISGKDAFLTESGSFRALRDATADSMIEITLGDAA